MSGLVTEAAVKRGLGVQASRPRALAASTLVALGAGVVVYRILRSGSPEQG